MLNKSEKGGNPTNMQFRPEKLEAPKIGTSADQYSIYLGNYKMYLASLSALREEFWTAVKRHNVSGEKDVTVWGAIKIPAQPRADSFSVQVDGSPVGEIFKEEEEAYLYAAARCGSEAQPALEKYAKLPPNQNLAPLKAAAALKNVRVVPSTYAPLPVSYATITKVSPEPKKTPPVASTPERLAAKKARKLARRKRSRITRAIKKTEENARLTQAKLLASKASAQLENWTLVISKKKAKQARLQKKRQQKLKGARRAKKSLEKRPVPIVTAAPPVEVVKPVVVATPSPAPKQVVLSASGRPIAVPGSSSIARTPQPNPPEDVRVTGEPSQKEVVWSEPKPRGTNLTPKGTGKLVSKADKKKSRK